MSVRFSSLIGIANIINSDNDETLRKTLVQTNLVLNVVTGKYVIPSLFFFKSDGQEISTKILISWQELKNRFLLFFVHK